MRVGYVQFSPVLGDQKANQQQIERLVLAAPPADLLVLPELCHSGYNFESAEQARDLAETAEGGPFVRFLSDLSAQKGANLVAGLCERDRGSDHLYNSAVLVGPNGLIGLYRKLHLFLNEKDFFSPGDLGLPVFEVDGARLGILICFDWTVPEAWRVLAIRGADIVCHPSNLVLPGLAQRSIPVQAMLNRLFVITANRIGTERGLSFTGRSILVDPKGELLDEASADEEAVGILEIDPARARDKAMTPRNDLLDDRRPEFYQDLL